MKIFQMKILVRLIYVYVYDIQLVYTYITIIRLMRKDQYFSAVDRYRCIMQPDRPHFSSGAAIVISIFMMIASVVLCVPKFVTATVSCFESKYVELAVLNLFLAILIQILKTRIF